MALGGLWSLYQAGEQIQHNRRARQSEQMLHESMQQYSEVFEFMQSPVASTVLGAGRLANVDDVAQANLLGRGALYMGAFENQPIFYNGDRHALSYGRTRSGKNRDIILPLLATNDQESLIVIDIKDGENAYASAQARKELGSKVIALNPLNIAGITSHRLNPCQTMLDLAQAGYELDGEDQQFIELFLPMTERQKQSDNSWTLEGAREILRIRAKYLAYYRPNQCNPAGLWHMANGDELKIRGQYQEMIQCGDPSIAEPAARYLHLFDTSEKQYAGYQTGLTRAVWPYEPNSVFAHETMCSDFDPADLKREHVTVFAMLPTDKIEMGSQWLTLTISMMMERIAAATGSIRTTVILDELANLPYMPIIPKALKLFAGKSVRMWGFCQGRHSLLDAGYTKETIREYEDQVGFLQLWEIEDTELLKDVESWSGKKGVATRSATMGGGGGLQGAFTVAEQARPVLQTEDIRAVGDGQQLLKVAGCPYLIHGQRFPYFDIPTVAERINDVRAISSGQADWKPERRKRVMQLPAPPPPEVEELAPSNDELLAMALAENDALRDQLAELKEQAGYELDIVDVLKKALAAVAQEKPA